MISLAKRCVARAAFLASAMYCFAARAASVAEKGANVALRFVVVVAEVASFVASLIDGEKEESPAEMTSPWKDKCSAVVGIGTGSGSQATCGGCDSTVSATDREPPRDACDDATAGASSAHSRLQAAAQAVGEKRPVRPGVLSAMEPHAAGERAASPAKSRSVDTDMSPGKSKLKL